MAVNKVTFAGETLIDLTGDTLTSAEQLVTGATAHTKSGASVTGTNPYVKAATDTAVTNALTALADKGVTLDGTEGVGDLAELIAAIEAGGSGAFTGTFIPASHTNVVSFGVPIPRGDFFVVVTAISEITMKTSTAYSRLIYITNIDGIVSGESHNNSTSDTAYPAGDSTSIKVVFDRNANTMTLNRSGTVPAYFYGGQEYIWFMGALDI